MARWARRASRQRPQRRSCRCRRSPRRRTGRPFRRTTRRRSRSVGCGNSVLPDATSLTSRRKQCPIKMARRRPRQLSLPTPPTWGGRRPGAGRPSTAKRPDKRHDARPAHEARHPVHVTIRARRELPSLRGVPAFGALCAALAAASDQRFRLIHFSVQTDHLHLIAEASSREALIRGLQGLAGRTARALNRCLRRHGKVWSGRYYARALATPREVRNALVYVLLNFRKHLRAAPAVDPRSSGPWFDGWSHAPDPNPETCPVAAPRTWLAAVGWRRAGGPLDPGELPAGRAPRNTSRCPRLVDSCG